MKWIWFAVASLLLAGGVSADSPPLEVDRSRLSQYWEPDLGSGGPPPAAFLGQLLSQGISGHFHLRGRINGDGSVDEVEVVEVSHRIWIRSPSSTASAAIDIRPVRTMRIDGRL